MVQWRMNMMGYVYVWRMGDSVLYVGSSHGFLERPAAAHKELGLEADSLEVWACVSREAAFRLERHLTRDLQPKRNIRNMWAVWGNARHRNRHPAPRTPADLGPAAPARLALDALARPSKKRTTNLHPNCSIVT